MSKWVTLLISVSVVQALHEFNCPPIKVPSFSSRQRGGTSYSCRRSDWGSI
jgi:hypothetical protein